MGKCIDECISPAAPPLHATMPLAPVFGSTSRARIVRALLGPSSVPRSRAQAPHSHARAKPPCTAWKRAVQIRPSVPSPPSSTIMGGCAQTPPNASRRHDQAWLAALERCAAPKSPWSVLQACIATGSHSRLMMLPTPRRTRPRSFGGRSYCAAAAPRRKQPHSVELDGAQSGGSYCSIRASSGSSMAPASTSVRMTVRWPRKLASMSAVWPHESRASTSRSSVPSSTRTMSM